MQEKQQELKNYICVVAIGMSGTGKTTFVNVIFRSCRNFSKLLRMSTASIWIQLLNFFHISPLLISGRLMDIRKYYLL